MSTQATFEELYEQYYSTHYKHLKLDAAFRHSYWKHRLDQLLPEDKEAVFLDAGCGNSDLLLYLKSKGYEQLHGVDLSQEMIGQAREILPEADLAVGDVIEYLKSKNQVFDFIFANHLLEHLEKQQVISFFKYANGALKPGGYLMSLTPNFASPFGLQMAFGDFTHLTPFSATALAQLAELSGLELVQTGGNGPVPHGAKGRLKSLAWKLGLEPVGKIIFSQGSNAHGNVVAPELFGLFQKQSA